jgi:hypothetical protein
MVNSGVGIRTNFLLIDGPKARHHHIRMVDLCDETFSTKTARGRAEAKLDASWANAISMSLPDDVPYARDVAPEEVQRNGHVLTVDRYLRSEKSAALEDFLLRHQTTPMYELAEIIRPAALPKAEDGALTVHEASPGDIGPRGLLQAPARVVSVDKGGARVARNQQILPGDVLLSIKGTIGAVGLAPENTPDRAADAIWGAGQSMVILRPKGRRISSIALFEYLSSDAVQGHLRSLAAGAAIQSITAHDIKEMKIPVPDEVTQAQVEAAFAERQRRHDEIDRLQQAIAQTRRASWPHQDLSQGDQNQR